MGERVDIAVEAEFFGVLQAAVPADAPAVAQPAKLDRLAHSPPAEDQRLDRKQRRVFRQIDVKTALQPCLVEQDRFLRQPGADRTMTEPQPVFHACGTATGFVDLLAGLTGYHDSRIVTDVRVDG